MVFEDTFLVESKVLPRENRLETKILDLMDDIENLTLRCLEAFNLWLKEVLKIHKAHKNLKNQSCSDKETDFKEIVVKAHTEGINKLGKVCQQSTKKELRVNSLKYLLDLLPLQARCMYSINRFFPVENYATILSFIITTNGAVGTLLDCFKDFLDYQDLKTYFWKALEIALMKVKLTSPFVHNTLLLINLNEKTASTSKRKLEVSNEEELKYFCGFEGASLSGKLIATSVLKIWEVLIRVEVSKNTKQLLVLTIIEQLMGRLDKPIFLTDYFMSCLDDGGAVSVLGLQGIFKLIQNHNINYPDIYTKLYSLFSTDIFSTPYKSRLYYLSDLFLSSTHLPEVLVAAFVKRLARLSLLAPPPDIIIMMKFITNLLLRHAGLKKLMHNNFASDVVSDPYDFEEQIPSKSRALESSLWEVKLLQHHALPNVAASAMFISNPLPSVEHSIADDLERTTSDIFTKEWKKKLKETPVCFEKPCSLLLPNCQSGISLWSFTD